MMRLVILVFVCRFFGSRLPAQRTNLPPPTEQYPFAKGSIERLDLNARSFILKTSAGKRVFEVTPTTYIFRGTEKIALDKLKIGEGIKLSYSTNELGQALVKRIKVDLPEPSPDPVRPPEAAK